MHHLGLTWTEAKSLTQNEIYYMEQTISDRERMARNRERLA